ncbi:hypothetical protein COOONC_00692, partial [Cooperia oncophora]
MILSDSKLLQRQFQLCNRTFLIMLDYVAHHQLALTLHESLVFLTKCRQCRLIPTFIRNMVQRFSYRQDAVRRSGLTSESEWGVLDPANVASREKCDSLRTETRYRRENKLTNLRNLTARPGFIIRGSIPPKRCVVLDGDRIDEDSLLNLGPSLAPKPRFTEEARIDVMAAISKFGYAHIWKEQTGATVPKLQESLRKAVPFLRTRVCAPLSTRKTVSNAPRTSYQSFDVSALYTNVDTRVVIEACIDLSRQHSNSCQLYGLSIGESEELL